MCHQDWALLDVSLCARKMREAYVAFIQLDSAAQDGSQAALQQVATSAAEAGRERSFALPRHYYFCFSNLKRRFFEVGAVYDEMRTFLETGTIPCSNRSYTLEEPLGEKSFHCTSQVPQPHLSGRQCARRQPRGLRRLHPVHPRLGVPLKRWTCFEIVGYRSKSA